MRHVKLGGIMSPMETMANVAASAAQSAREATTRQSGTISVPNADGTRSILGVQNGNGRSMATHVGDTTPPGVPTGVTATSTSGMLTVHWDGTLDGGVPGDFSHVSVYIVDDEGSKSLLGSLSRAGDLTAAGLTEGATYEVTATAEDDACLADGTPAHNVSVSTEPIYVTIAALGGTDETARQMAQEAKDAANATSQSFWADGSGVHVSTEDGDPAGTSNVLINALGILLRAAQNNMLALTPSGITLYDGKGNADANVVATFTDSGVELGKNSMESVIKFCGGKMRMAYEVDPLMADGSRYSVIDSDSPFSITSSKSSALRYDNGVHTANGNISSYVSASPYEKDSSGTIRGATLSLHGSDTTDSSDKYGQYFDISLNSGHGATPAWIYVATKNGSTQAPLSRLATAIQPVVLYNGGAALDYDTAPGVGTNGDVTLSESAANFSKLKIFFRTDDNAYGSCEVPSPDGKNVDLSANHPSNKKEASRQATRVWIKGASVAIFGTSMTVSAYVNMGVYEAGNTLAEGNIIYVVRVEGIR